MHIFSMSVTYLQVVEKIQGVDFTKYALSTIIYYVQLSKTGLVKNPVSLSKKIFFSASTFFMHIFNMSVTYLQTVEKIQWKLLEELISQSIHCQPLFIKYSRRKMATF